jgi:glycosyltransferase involved in cell wall biosynthesis
VFGTGAPEYLSKLKDKIAVANLPTTSTGWVFKNKALPLRRIDVCVVPSCFGDPFPNGCDGSRSLRVAGCRNRRRVGLPEIVEDGVTGWIVEVNAPKELLIRFGMDHG